MPDSALGFTLDRQYGLLWHNPLFFLLPVGLWSLWKKRSAWWRGEAAVIAPYLGMLLVYRFWSAGWAPADRFLVPIAPLLWLPVYEGLIGMWNSRVKALAGALLAGSLLVAGLHWQEPKLFWMAEGTGFNPWMDSLTVGSHSWQKYLPSAFSPPHKP